MTLQLPGHSLPTLLVCQTFKPGYEPLPLLESCPVLTWSPSLLGSCRHALVIHTGCTYESRCHASGVLCSVYDPEQKLSMAPLLPLRIKPKALSTHNQQALSIFWPHFLPIRFP